MENSRFTNDLLSGLNSPQLEAVQHVDGPLLVLAGAGSGKTRVITRRVAYLVSQGIDPGNVLAITFTNKAAEEMQHRVAAMRTPYGATVCTFHSLCARLLREFAYYAGLRENYSIYDRNDQLKVAKQAIESADLNTSDRITPARAHAAISNAKNAMMTPDSYESRANDFFSRNISHIYRRYEKILAENNAVDFDDLLMRMAFVLRDNADIRDFLTQRYRYVLIDEYQDTNHAQYCIARDIAAGHHNICATGDPDQSIYAWRGADINNILDFEKDYRDAKVIRLEENYRSRAPILSAASKLISFNTRRKSKKLFTIKAGGENVRVITVDDERAEAQLVAKEIDDYRMSGGAYSDVAIFYRANSQSRVIEDALMKKGIPYRIARGVEFYNRKEIKDMLAYLKLLNNPADSGSCERIINVPARGIGDTTVKKLRFYGMDRGLSILQVAQRVSEVGLNKGTTTKVAKFASIMTSLAADLHKPVRIIMEDVFKHSGMEDMLKPTDEETRQARANVEELISAAAEFDDEHPDATLGEYLQGVSLVSDVDHWEGSDGSVMLMTLHAAKGLEFPVVFMVGVEEELLPFSRGSSFGPEEAEDKDQIEEERRLAFVGITRTMEKLTMLSARVRTIRGQRLPRTSSRFLDEIGSEDITRDDKTTEIPAARHRGGFRGFGSGFGKKSFGDDDWSDFHEAMGRKKKSRCDEDDDDEIVYESDEDYESHAPEFPIEYEGLCKGCRVHHPKYGTGKVISMSQPWPDTKVEVMFQTGAVKKFVLAMAKLEIVG